MRFLIADDHPIIVVAVGEILEAAFGQGGCETDTVSTGESVLHAVGQAAYCLVLDLDMPGRPRSVPLLAEVKGVAHDIRMAVYTGHANTCLALAALEAGAAAYVSKASGRRLALDAIRTVVDGGRFVDPSIDLEVASNHAWRCLTASKRRECRAQVADGRPWPRSSVGLRARAGTAESW